MYDYMIDGQADTTSDFKHNSSNRGGSKKGTYRIPWREVNSGRLLIKLIQLYGKHVIGGGSEACFMNSKTYRWSLKQWKNALPLLFYSRPLFFKEYVLTDKVSSENIVNRIMQRHHKMWYKNERRKGVKGTRKKSPEHPDCDAKIRPFFNKAEKLFSEWVLYKEEASNKFWSKKGSDGSAEDTLRDGLRKLALVGMRTKQR